MRGVTDYGCSGMNNGIKVCHFIQAIRGHELEAPVNVVQAQPEKHGMDFDTTMSYLGQMLMKKSLVMQSIQAAFMGKVECNKYTKAVWYSMTKEQA